MTVSLEKNLYSKRRLSFGEDGRFKILMFSDIQELHTFDREALYHINAMLDCVKPDLVILGGDQCLGKEVRTKENFELFLSFLAGPMESRNIPWVHVFGNHDYETDITALEQESLYEAYPCCLSKHTGGLSGVTNYMLPIYRRDSEKIGFNIWALDTQRYIDRFFADNGMPGGVRLRNESVGIGDYDIIRFDQMLWYWNSSVELEKYAGEKIPALMCMHIAPIEFSTAINQPQLCGTEGYYPERLDAGMLNSGIFAEVLQRGDVCGICCAHTHRNNFEADLLGLKLYFDGSAGLRCYGDAQSRGGRVFEIDQDDPRNIRSYPYYYKL